MEVLELRVLQEGVEGELGGSVSCQYLRDVVRRAAETTQDVNGEPRFDCDGNLFRDEMSGRGRRCPQSITAGEALLQLVDVNATNLTE